MRDKKFFICLVLLISSVIIGCKWQMPETVSVKTEATYEFSMGDFQKSLDSEFSSDKLFGDISKNGKMKIYDYFPGKADPNTQRYLIEMPIVEIPLDLKKFMDDANFTKGIEDVSFNKEINIPNFAVDPVSVDIPGINGFVNSAITLPVIDVKFAEMLPPSSGVQSCEIKDGYLNVELVGCTAPYDVTLTSSGGLTLGTDKNASDSEKTVSLKGAKVTAGASKIAVTIKFTGEGNVTNPKIKITPVISTLESVTADIGETPKFEKNEPFSKEITDMIQKIVLNPSGVDVKYVNTLPAGNDMTLNVTSNFFEINGSSTTLAGGAEKTESIRGANKKTIMVEEGTAIDFNVGIKLPGSSEGSNLMTVKGVAPGQSYKVGVTLVPIIDWESITVSSTDFKKTDKQDLNFNLYKMFYDLDQQLGGNTGIMEADFKKFPIYLYCSKPEATLDGLSLNGKASLFLGDKDGNLIPGIEPEYILGTYESPENMNFAKRPNIEQDSDKAVITVLDTLDKSASKDMHHFINNAKKVDGGVWMNYDLNIASSGSNDSLTITKAQLEGKAATISVYAYIDVGFSLDISKDLNMNLAKMMNLSDTDILNGNGANMREQGTDKYIKAIKAAGIDYSMKTLPFYTEAKEGITFKLKVNAVKDPWKFGLKSGKFVVTREQLLAMINAPKVIVENMDVCIPKGTFSIPRSKKFDANIKMRLETDGTVEIIGGK